MTIIQAIETIADWLNENVCPRLILKRPSDCKQGTFYDYEEVHPVAFAMFLPGSDKLPEGISTQCPYILVQLLDGENNLLRKVGRFNIQLSFMAWNPGVHPDETGMKDVYRRSAEGWKDAWSLLERTVADIENAEYINGIRFVKESGVKFGQFQKDGQIADTYPYFYAWATMVMECGVNIIASEYSNYL